MTDTEGNIEPLEIEQDKQPVFRFRPPQIAAITKCVFSFIILSFYILSFIENSLLVILIMNYLII